MNFRSCIKISCRKDFFFAAGDRLQVAKKFNCSGNLEKIVFLHIPELLEQFQ